MPNWIFTPKTDCLTFKGLQGWAAAIARSRTLAADAGELKKGVTTMTAVNAMHLRRCLAFRYVMA
jgi:hypothetical protein